MELWKYVALAVALASGLVGVFFGNDGARNTVKGVGWMAVVLLLVASGIAFYQTHEETKSNREATLRADEAEAKLKLTQAALISGVLSGTDLSQPIGRVSLLIDMPVVTAPDGSTYHQKPLLGFIGPFPALMAGEQGEFSVRVTDKLDYSVKLTAARPGVLRLSEASGATYLLTAESGSGGVRLEGSGQAPAVADGQWTWEAEDQSIFYALALESRAQVRGLLAALSQDLKFGSLTVPAPKSEVERKRLVATITTELRPSFLVLLGVAKGSASSEGDDKAEPADDCVNRVRIPLAFELVGDAPSPKQLTFVLRARPTGFEPEICGYVH